MLILSFSRSAQSLRRHQGVVVSFLLAFGSTSAVYGQVATTTQLTVSAPTVAVGVPTLLTATVTDAASHSVHLGTVTFYDGTRSLGSAQIVSGNSGAYPQGTANLKTASLSRGTNSIKAMFTATKSDAASTSAAKAVTVTGASKTTTTLSGYVTGTDFWMPATLRAYGPGTPTGNMNYLHIFGDATLGTKSLSGATWKGDLSISSSPGVGPGAAGMVAGDFNGDGFPDLATANERVKGDTISVVLGNGDGTFTPQVSYAIPGDTTQAIYAADFNNDGKLDLAIPNSDNSAAGILLGNGDGTFQPEVDYGSLPHAAKLFIGDFNRDGNLDIALLSLTNNPNVVMLLGNGDGTFKSQTFVEVHSGADLSGGDLNGDGFLDLVVANDSGLHVLLGNGDGTFLASTLFQNLGGANITLADVNGDGKLDAVVFTESILVGLGKGDGTFETPHVYPFANQNFPASWAVADIDQDGKLDIAMRVTNPIADNRSLQVFYGNGDGTFEPGVNYLTSSSFTSQLITGDFNGDGRTDLAEPIELGNTANVILNGRSTSLLLAKEELGPGTTTVDAKYSGDEAFAGSVSNAALLTPNGTPAPTYPTGFEDSSKLQFNGSAIPSDSAPAFSFFLTTGVMNQAGSAFYGAPQNIQAFTTDFEYVFASYGSFNADGLTFTIQNEGPQAVGGPGGGLGYKSIPKSVAVKFDLYDNSGEGNNSTGLYINGASPDVPAVDLTSSGVNLQLPVPIDVHIAYNGSTLTLTITEPVTSATFTDSWPIDIPAVVGGTTAYVGFTGGTGSPMGAFVSRLKSWTYVPGMP